MSTKFAVEVAYALPDHQLIVSLEVDAGTTALQAVELSGIREKFEELANAQLELGVFGRSRPADHVLRAGDRVEIYRQLLVDPKELRRQRAKQQTD